MKRYLTILVLFFGITSQVAFANEDCPNISMNLGRGMSDGNSNGQVTILQRFLASYFLLSGDDIISGYFGPVTESYILRFQRENNLSQVGNLGPRTREAVLNVCRSKTSTDQIGVVQPSTQTQTPTPKESKTSDRTTTTTKKPNIIVIMTDDQDDMGSMKYLPKIKKLLIDQGVVFKNSFVSFPVVFS